jgi:hypothetical protein
MYGFGGRRLLMVAVVLVLALLAVTPAGALSLDGVAIVDAPGFSYALDVVSFSQPRSISTGAGKTAVSQMVRVVVHGQGFRPRATGPVVWLNGVPTLRTQVSDDGTTIEAYFTQSAGELSTAADGNGAWAVIVQPTAAGQAWRVSPTGNPADAAQRPAIGAVTK